MRRATVCRVAAQNILLDAGFEQREAPPPESLLPFDFAPFEFNERRIDFARALVELALAGQFGDARQNAVDEGVFVGSALAPGDNVECDSDGVFEFNDRAVEIQRLLGFEPLRQSDDRAAFEAFVLCAAGQIRVDGRGDSFEPFLHGVELFAVLPLLLSDCAGVVLHFFDNLPRRRRPVLQRILQERQHAVINLILFPHFADAEMIPQNRHRPRVAQARISAPRVDHFHAGDALVLVIYAMRDAPPLVLDHASV